MSLHLLDSDAVIDHLKGIQSTIDLIAALSAGGPIACSCDIVVSEVYAGLPPAARAGAQQLLSTLYFLPTTAAAARQSGIWRYDFARRGVTLPTTDTLIAAVAAEHGAHVVTGNVRDYPMAGVTVVPLSRVQGRPRP